MAKRSSTRKPTKRAPDAPETMSGLERQILAFAEHLGFVAGSIQSKAEGVLDRETLSRQVTSVRDGAKHLLEQIASGVASRVRRSSAPKRPVRKARSGGTVDAPGKKHRKPAPSGPSAAAARTRNARVRAATPTAKMVAHLARQG